MTVKKTKSKIAVASKVIQPLEMAKPYDPLDLRTLAESMAKVVLEQPVQPLASIPPFQGAGIYVIYYTGNFPPYQSIAEKNVRNKWRQPIYVGEATRKGGRKGGVLAEGPPGRALHNRLRNHADSINGVENLKLEHFWYRYLSLKDFFIPLCESLLIDRYIPVWNKVIDGFGNKVVGAGREQQQQKSMWDVLHPGRVGAAASPNKKYPTAEVVLDRLLKFNAGKPIPLISTKDAVAATERSNESQD